MWEYATYEKHKKAELVFSTTLYLELNVEIIMKTALKLLTLLHDFVP